MQQHEISSLPPTKYFSQDFPPVPKCFLHLLRNNEFGVESVEESRSRPRSPSNQDNNSKAEEMIGDFISHHPQKPSTKVNSRSLDTTCPDSMEKRKIPGHQDDNNGKQSHSLRTTNFTQNSETDRSDEKRQLLGKLNTSLSNLKKEMTDLRSLDVSLFFQLLSLHEAIQDFKMTVGDRFSETGSEYSLESTSYMGSMSSLSEEDIDLMDAQLKSLDDSQVFVNNQSASSLLDQITELVQKADADF